jgi:hypothetical protein
MYASRWMVQAPRKPSPAASAPAFCSSACRIKRPRRVRPRRVTATCMMHAGGDVRPFYTAGHDVKSFQRCPVAPVAAARPASYCTRWALGGQSLGDAYDRRALLWRTPPLPIRRCQSPGSAGSRVCIGGCWAGQLRERLRRTAEPMVSVHHLALSPGSSTLPSTLLAGMGPPRSSGDDAEWGRDCEARYRGARMAAPRSIQEINPGY